MEFGNENTKDNSQNALNPIQSKNLVEQLNITDFEQAKALFSELLSNSETNQVIQSNNTIGHDAVGRDKIVTNNLNIVYDKSIYLKSLYEKFILEEKSNPVFKSFINDLDYYNSQIGDEVIIGLDNKLTAGNRTNIIWYAKEVKERFHKKLLQTSQFSEVAQKINVYLLATVRSYYMLEVYPHICNNEDPTLINSLIATKIVNPLTVELGDNLFDFTPDDIQGMLYFLTGNCHIKWTA